VLALVGLAAVAVGVVLLLVALVMRTPGAGGLALVVVGALLYGSLLARETYGLRLEREARWWDVVTAAVIVLWRLVLVTRQS
jgi:hypothetical protein